MAFHGQNGHCTLRKERRKRGDTYWYAYRGEGKRLYKRYVGKTAHLTTTHLEEIVRQLASHHTPPISLNPQTHLPPLTRFSAPHLQFQLVARAHLIDQIERGIQGPLTLISAPAGFGKTTILAQWFQQKKVPAVWLSLEAQDNHPTRFLHYVLSAFQQFDPELSYRLLLLTQSRQQTEIEAILTLLADEITIRHIPFIVLILDDYHVINTEAIHRYLVFFCNRPAPGLRLVLLTRVDPPLPLALMRARGQLTELRADQLRFNFQESATFLQERMGLKLSDENVRLLDQRTEGWVAGLQLAALSLRSKTDVAAYLRDFGGSNRFVLDYLSNEVISHLPASTLNFLLHTCILERLHDSLCAAVLQCNPREIQGMLPSLERNNLFVTALDEEGNWYRYHHLFATMLQAHLTQSHPELIQLLHRRASEWYQQNGYEIEAMHHALLMHDNERVLELLKSTGWPMLLRGEHLLLLEWLERLSKKLEYEQPQLCLLHAAALAFLTRTEAAQEMLQYAERPLNPQAEPAPAGEVATIRTLIASIRGDLDQAEQAAQLALSQLPPNHTFLQRLAHGSQALIYARKGTCVPAIESLRAAASSFWTIDQAVGMAYLYLDLGQLQKGARICQEVLGYFGKAPLPPLPYLGAASIVLGQVHYERNECQEAIPRLREGIERCKQTGELIFLSLGYIILAHLLLFKTGFMEARPPGNPEAFELARQAHELLLQQRLERLWVSSSAPWLLLRFFLACGKIEEAQQLVERQTGAEQSCAVAGASYPLQMEALAFAYLYLARQQPERTLELLSWPIQAAEEDERAYQLVFLLILQSKAYLALQQPMAALQSLEQALHFAEPGGIVRPFLEEGPAFADLLLRLYEQLQSHSGQVSRSFVQTLLNWLGCHVPAPPSSSAREESSLLDPLTRSEVEVLRLMGAGLSNKEIARQMVIEVGTVKWHIHHIYEKLHAHTRAQAILEAQARGLLR